MFQLRYTATSIVAAPQSQLWMGPWRKVPALNCI